MKQLVESFYALYRSGLRNPKYRWLIIFGTLTYILSPLDISPDLLPIVGWIDDGVLITLLLTEVFYLFQGAFSSSDQDMVDEQTPANEDDDEGVVIDVKAQEVP
ncbi:DUF1232 domain-containing protein [Leptolyngbyaceae cyanobacterium CCMR0082]|uniref:DUF1232 domain-containing protein n=2 Tax=Adonisia turfae TaxID=2950184 RepID=A0A6M0SI24_9CYAN|nr:YkvA family protein [Adonisia turfae]NEZ59774.1 DUF1232 domain-containing protein [Adonisia turfae CCMR0081]NEZ68157.1 DUF1232 domain-containing protein [Adonisia turfae CCMR0082]